MEIYRSHAGLRALLLHGKFTPV